MLRNVWFWQCFRQSWSIWVDDKNWVRCSGPTCQQMWKKRNRCWLSQNKSHTNQATNFHCRCWCLFSINYNIIWRVPFLLAVNIAKNRYFVLFLKQRKKTGHLDQGEMAIVRLKLVTLFVAHHILAPPHCVLPRYFTYYQKRHQHCWWQIGALQIRTTSTPLHPIPATVLHEWMSDNTDFSKPEEASFGSLSLVLLASWLWPGENSFRFTSSQFALKIIGCLFS